MRANWLTLPEAVAQIVRVDPCQPEDAQRQLGNALANGDLWPLCWEDERVVPTGPNAAGVSFPIDIPPQKWSKAEIERIDWEDGTAFDRSEFTPRKGRRRRLLIHRLAIRQWWPESKEQPARGQPKPTPAELDEWMHRTVKRGAKRDDTIANCRKATGATFRDAIAAWRRLPDVLKLKRGQRTPPRKIEQ
jgi:hypothetical protein